MEKYIVWYQLQWKAWLKKRSCWLQIAGMVLLVLLVSSAVLPDSANRKVGVCKIEDESARAVVKSLKESGSLFEFQEFEEEARMQQQVVSGKLECGFIFTEGFGEKLQKGRQKNLVTYLCTPLTTKGEVIQETFYTAVLEQYGNHILAESSKTVFGREDPALVRELQRRSREYLDGGELFRLEVRKVTDSGAEAGKKEPVGYPVQGIVGLMVFTVMLMAHGRKFGPRGRNVHKALTAPEGRIFDFLNCIAAGTAPAIAGLLLILCAPGSRGIWREVAAMAVLLVLSGIWILVFGRLLKSETTFAAWVLTLVASQLFLCPVFTDFSRYIPALKYLGFLYPLGFYLSFS